MTEQDTDYTTFPTCPSCGESDQDWWDGLPPKNDGDEWEADCSACGTKYKVTMSVDVSFCTSR